MCAVLLSLGVIALHCPFVAAQKPEPKYEGKPLAYWIERFQKAENEKDRFEAERAICAFGTDASPAVPALMVMLDDRSESYRTQVARMLCAIGSGAKGAVPDLIKMLEEKSPRDPNAVILILCAIGPDAKNAIPAIRRVSMDFYKPLKGDGHVPFSMPDRSNFDYQNLGPDVVPLLLDIIDAGDCAGKGNAFRSLGELGPKAKPAASRLTRLLKHEDAEVRLEAARALWAVENNPTVIPVFAALLKTENGYIAISAAKALGDIGPAAKEALPALKRLVPKGEPAPEPVSAVPVNVPTGYEDSDLRKLREAARKALQRIEGGTKK